MTTSIPGYTTESWDGRLAPTDVAKVIELIIGGAPFANSLTRDPTSKPRKAYPTANPQGFGWVAELERIPQVSLNDDAVVVGVARLAGLIDLSNSLVNDAAVNVTTTVGQLLAEGIGPDLDRGLLFGQGGASNEPQGIVAMAPEVAAADLLDAVAGAKGEIGDAGGLADTLAMSATALARADAERDNTGRPVWSGGFAAAQGLRAVSVPGLTTPLVYDSRRLYLLINGLLSQVDISKDYHFGYDATTFRVQSRVSVACPVPERTIRKLAVPAATGSSSPSVAAKRSTAATK